MQNEISTPIPKVLIKIATDHGCTVSRSEHCEPNQGACAGNELFLGEYDDPDLEAVAFFHELGHYVSSKEFKHVPFWLNKITSEAIAWEYGFKLAAQYGFSYHDYQCKERQYAKKCLLSYKDTVDNWE